MIGINSRGQGRGIGFTIPIDTAKRVSGDLLDEGRIARGYPRRHAAAAAARPRALLGPAERARRGRRLGRARLARRARRPRGRRRDSLKFDGEALHAEKEEDLGQFQRAGRAAQRRSRRGDRGAARRRAQDAARVALGPAQVRARRAGDRRTATPSRRSPRRASAASALPQREGVLVSYVESGSEADEAGMERGDLIVEIDKAPVTTLDQFRSASQAAARRQALPGPRAARRRHALPPGLAARRDPRRQPRAEHAKQQQVQRRRAACGRRATAVRQWRGVRPKRARKRSRERAAKSLGVSAAHASCTVQPPKPAPVMRAPRQPASSRASATSASLSAQVTAKSSRRLAWPGEERGARGVELAARERGLEVQHALVLGDDVARAAQRDRIERAGQRRELGGAQLRERAEGPAERGFAPAPRALALGAALRVGARAQAALDPGVEDQDRERRRQRDRRAPRAARSRAERRARPRRRAPRTGPSRRTARRRTPPRRAGRAARAAADPRPDGDAVRAEQRERGRGLERGRARQPGALRQVRLDPQVEAGAPGFGPRRARTRATPRG